MLVMIIIGLIILAAVANAVNDARAGGPRCDCGNIARQIWPATHEPLCNECMDERLDDTSWSE